MSCPAPLSYTCRLRGSPFLGGFWEEKGTEEHEEIRSSGGKGLDGPQGTCCVYQNYRIIEVGRGLWRSPVKLSDQR